MSCRSCDPPGSFGPMKRALKKVTHGVVGATKVALKVNRAAPEEILRRRQICETCSLSLPKDKPLKLRYCGKPSDILKPSAEGCGCPILKKVILKNEICPRKNW